MITKLTGAIVTLVLIGTGALLSNFVSAPAAFAVWGLLIPLWIYSAIELARIEDAWHSDVR